MEAQSWGSSFWLSYGNDRTQSRVRLAAPLPRMWKGITARVRKRKEMRSIVAYPRPKRSEVLEHSGLAQRGDAQIQHQRGRYASKCAQMLEQPPRKPTTPCPPPQHPNPHVEPRLNRTSREAFPTETLNTRKCAQALSRTRDRSAAKSCSTPASRSEATPKPNPRRPGKRLRPPKMADVPHHTPQIPSHLAGQEIPPQR